jgi:hypothetical protein
VAYVTHSYCVSFFSSSFSDPAVENIEKGEEIRCRRRGGKLKKIWNKIQRGNRSRNCITKN